MVINNGVKGMSKAVKIAWNECNVLRTLAIFVRKTEPTDNALLRLKRLKEETGSVIWVPKGSQP